LTDTGRVVVVAAGFALWSGGRCVAASRWADVRRLRAYVSSDAADSPLLLGVELLDGTIMELHEAAPGFDAFLDRASATLAGLLPFKAWYAPFRAGTSHTEGVVIYERVARRY